MTPDNPVVGSTVLRRPAIQSPNFNMAAQTGWSIDANGNAYFFNVTATGTITSTTVVVQGSAGGVFVYSGSPALGNLIVSAAGATATDAYGNSYPEGINVTAGTISGTTISGSSFDGTDFILNTSGAFFYSGTPASGNLIASVVSAAGTDGFGNAYNAGIWSYAASGVKAGLTSASGSGTLSIDTGDASQTSQGGMYAATVLSGPGRVLVNNITAPEFASDPGATSILMRSTSFDGTTIPQQIQLNVTGGSVQLIGTSPSIPAAQFHINSPGINVPLNTCATANQTISTTGYSNLTGILATLLAGATYLVEVEIYWVPSGTIGSNHTHGFNYPGTAASDTFTGTAYQATSTGTINQATGTTSTALNVSNVDVVTSPTHLGFRGWTRIAGYITTTTGGTFRPVIKVGTAADTVQVTAGSFMKVTRLS